MMSSSFFCLTVRFLQPYSHGRGGDGDPEWPPSPLRVFQALVSAAAARWNERMRLEYAAPALRWLEECEAPLIVAADAISSGLKYRLYVPDNVADKVAASWSGGRGATIADYRTEKDVRPMRLNGESVNYLFRLANGECPHLDVLSAAARSITHLGWGVDMVVASAAVVTKEKATALSGEWWGPVNASSDRPLRVPIGGTMKDLAGKHTAFLDRVSDDAFRPVPPLTAFRVVGYRRDTDPPPRPIAAFSILKLDGSGYRPFDPARRTATVAGMVRFALSNAAKAAGWSADRIAQVVHGHAPDGSPGQSSDDQPRFAYVPLPSIERRGSGAGGAAAEHVGSIRRILVVGKPGMEDEMAFVRRALSGQELIDENSGQALALLAMIPTSDPAVRRFTAPSTSWSTVTPLILPGYDDPAHLRHRLKKPLEQAGAEEQKRLLARLDRRTDELIRKAFGHAGYGRTLIDAVQIEWQKVAYLAGVDRADRYLPEKFRKYSCYHVRIHWRDSIGQPLGIAGPIIVGGGRFAGLGLFLPDR